LPRSSDERVRALVTGASSGIGAACARALADDGYAVVLAARDESRLGEVAASLKGAGHLLVVGDITLAEDRRALVERAGVVRAVVHCAGKHAFSIPTRVDRQLSEIFDVNVEGPIALTAELLANDGVASGGAIVFISSAAAAKGSKMTSSYAASKAALIGYARALAADLAPRGIRVLTVVPGLVDTPMGKKILDQAGDAADALRAQHPLGIGQPEDIAGVVAFACSERARWITGTEIVVDGGYSLR
jgi:NAD(P)-dependent dehydrogenase (short-subunit alcohol dehydrogenase family)